ncbi:NAD(P)-dependent oxidoreductase [Streptomyces boncukensis]|uniref:NAD(P)-dependent oxidoreductase n=1 Tax=Streptomyces boncukensis TaxID=2711219 RepID=A0A6G4X0L5_9ACTN|nr:NAD(P)-dependent oxidoreductase [Streptomyces boncukensis]NGO70430.1 NAD(P)-dependent oxidoreductase [Streptomyces boncukensis]
MTHPKRLRAAEKLAASAPPGALRVVMDPDPGGRPSVLRTALAAWSAIEEDATHHLVVQDDMILSAGLFARARAAIEQMPDAALALFALWDSRNGAAVRFGALAGARWVGAVNEYFPCVAIVLPRNAAAGFVRYGRERLDGWPDDILMYRYLSARGIPSYVSVPNLAEHEDHGSISGNAFRGPRRSVCFVPSDLPGDEGARLTGLRVVPFFKHGVAQCAVRHPGPGPTRWLHLTCEQYLDGAGVRTAGRTGRGRPAIVRMAEGIAPGAADATWLTALTMGFTALREGHRADGGGTAGTPLPDAAVVREALSTVGPGGISQGHTEEQIAACRDALLRVAREGLDAGREEAARLRAPGARTHTRTPSVEVLGAATPLGEHLVRTLSDRGHRVAAGTPGRRTGSAPAATVDLRPLRGGGPASVRVTVRANGAPYAPARVRTLLVGDVYGPGCGRESRIGRMVWEALRSRPVVLDDAAESPVHPLHVRDLADAVSLVLRTPPSEPAVSLAEAVRCTVGELAETVRASVRPVAVETGAATAAAPRRADPPGPPDPPQLRGWRPAVGLAYGLHTHAQWLAYEGVRLVPL